MSGSPSFGVRVTRGRMFKVCVLTTDDTDKETNQFILYPEVSQRLVLHHRPKSTPEDRTLSTEHKSVVVMVMLLWYFMHKTLILLSNILSNVENHTCSCVLDWQFHRKVNFVEKLTTPPLILIRKAHWCHWLWWVNKNFCRDQLTMRGETSILATRMTELFSTRPKQASKLQWRKW